MTPVGGVAPAGWANIPARVEGFPAAGVRPAADRAPGDPAAGAGAATGFGELLGRALDGLEAAERRADMLAARLAAGEPVELHEVVIASEKVQLAFELAVQIRNRAVEAYQEIMRMPV